MKSTHYHAHIYFGPETRGHAQKFRQAILDLNLVDVKVWELIDRPIGPHPLPMFEVDFSNERFEFLMDWFKKNHKELSILIHENTGHDLRDHTEGAFWLGEKQALVFSIFKT